MADIVINPKHVRPLLPSSVIPKTAGFAGQVGDFVYFSDDDTVEKTDADTAATVAGKIGQIVSAGRHEPSGAFAEGERVGVLTWGRVSYGPDANLDLTKPLFISNTPGKAADAAGTNSKRIGSPESSEVFFLDSE